MKDHDVSTSDPFVEYYARQSESEQTRARFVQIHDIVLRALGREHGEHGALDVADIGCGAGTQCLIWGRDGHRVHGIDINEPLVRIARERAGEAGLEIDLRVGSSERLPWDDASMDVCLVPELLEHVEDWQSCVDEFCRILRPGGVLYVSTTNALCPRQQEFDLPLYSWYPGILKRRYERLARSRRPELVNHASFPAVNWFTFYGLRRVLRGRGFDSLDRFDVMNLEGKPVTTRALVHAIRRLPPLRLLAQFATPYTLVVAIRRAVE